MRAFCYKLFAFMAMVYLFVPAPIWAAGKKAKPLVHVADTRLLSGIYLYFGNMYNENLLMFGVWTVVIITAFGSVLGFTMDIIISRIGLDLRSRELRE